MTELPKRYLQIVPLNTPSTILQVQPRPQITNSEEPIVLSEKQKLVQSYMIGRDTSPRVAVDYEAEYTKNHGSAPVYDSSPMVIGALSNSQASPPNEYVKMTLNNWVKNPGNNRYSTTTNAVGQKFYNIDGNKISESDFNSIVNTARKNTPVQTPWVKPNAPVAPGIVTSYGESHSLDGNSTGFFVNNKPVGQEEYTYFTGKGPTVYSPPLKATPIPTPKPSGKPYLVVNAYNPLISKITGLKDQNAAFLIQNLGKPNEKITIVGAGGNTNNGGIIGNDTQAFGYVLKTTKVGANYAQNMMLDPAIDTTSNPEIIGAINRYLSNNNSNKDIDYNWVPFSEQNPNYTGPVSKRRQRLNKKQATYKTTPKKSASTKKSLMMRVQNVQTIKPITYVKSKPLGIKGFKEINKSKSKPISIKGFGFGGMSGKVNTQMFKSGSNIKGMTGVKPKKPVKQPQKSFKNLGKGLF